MHTCFDVCVHVYHYFCVSCVMREGWLVGRKVEVLAQVYVSLSYLDHVNNAEIKHVIIRLLQQLSGSMLRVLNATHICW